MHLKLTRMSDDVRSGATWPYRASLVELYDGLYQRVDYVEAFAVVGGEGRQSIHTPHRSSVTQRLLPGQMFLYRPSDVTLIEGHATKKLSFLAVSVPLHDWQIFADFAGIDPSWRSAPHPPAAFFDPDDENALAPLYAGLRRFQEGANRLDLLRVMADITSYFLPLRDRPHLGSGVPTWLARSIDAMHFEANLRGGVSRLGEIAHVSPSHLSRTVRRYYGVTPSVLLNDLRLRRAAVLLGTTDDSIGSIADRCGFSSVAYFSARFRRAYEVSPRGYRSGISRIDPSVANRTS